MRNHRAVERPREADRRLATAAGRAARARRSARGAPGASHAARARSDVGGAGVGRAVVPPRAPPEPVSAPVGVVALVVLASAPGEPVVPPVGVVVPAVPGVPLPTPTVWVPLPLVHATTPPAAKATAANEGLNVSA